MLMTLLSPEAYKCMKNLIDRPDFTPRTLSFGQIPCFRYNQILKDEIAAGRLSAADAVFMYIQMLDVRAFENTIIKLRNGEIVPFEGYKFSGATHLSIGQEAVAVGANAALRADDYITSSHRGHGHSIAKESYALRAMNADKLSAFISDLSADGQALIKKYYTPAPVPVVKFAANDTLSQALDVHLYRTMAEFLGKEHGYCRGVGGGMHIADFNVGHLGANAIVGGSIPIAAGAGVGQMLQSSDKVTLCFFGDGACNNGVFAESMNFTCMGQFKRGAPVVFLIENNQFGMTGRTRYEINGIDYLARRGWGYNKDGMHAEVVNGMSPLAVYDAVRRAVEICRKGEGPVLLEAMTYRYQGHSLSDQNAYRSAEEIEAWRCEDAIERMKAELVKANVVSPEAVDQIEKNEIARMEAITMAAANGPYPDPKTVMDGLYSNSTSDSIGPEFKTTEYNAAAVKDYRDKEDRMPYRRAVAEALMEEMLRDKRVILYGEDVAEHGGAFAATSGLLDIFGRERVFNAPISEATICGAAVGMAMTGLRPVCELMYIDFILMSMDQLGNQAAKNKYMFGGKAKLPMVCRTTIGGGKGYAGQHSQSLEAVAAGMPGLKVVLPYTAADAKGLLKAAIRDDNPVIFIEHQLLYGEKCVVPRGDFIVPLGKAAVRREGKDVTLIAYSYMTMVAEKAAAMLAKQGISAEVIDVRTLIPLDVETITASITKTNHAAIVSQAPGTGCFGEHIAFEIQKHVFDYLDAPIELVAAYDCPPPMAPTLEEEFMPNAEKVTTRVLKMLNK
jgi:2-oxoisovalerate dehydrogenase E1 component